MRKRPHDDRLLVIFAAAALGLATLGFWGFLIIQLVVVIS